MGKMSGICQELAMRLRGAVSALDRPRLGLAPRLTTGLIAATWDASASNAAGRPIVSSAFPGYLTETASGGSDSVNDCPSFSASEHCSSSYLLLEFRGNGNVFAWRSQFPTFSKNAVRSESTRSIDLSYLRTS